MTSAALALNNSGPNYFQTYLFPEESKWVRFCMCKAAEYSGRSDVLLSHVVSVGCVVMAVAMSFFNALSYLIEIPLQIPLHVVRFELVGLVYRVGYDLLGVAKSALFVSMGATLIVAGLVFPKVIFPHFAPEYYLPLVDRQAEEITRLQKSSEIKDEEIDELSGEVRDRFATRIQELERKLYEIEHPIRSRLPKFC